MTQNELLAVPFERIPSGMLFSLCLEAEEGFDAFAEMMVDLGLVRRENKNSPRVKSFWKKMQEV